MEILFYFLSYFLTLSGYLLGKSTKEEHNEIKNKVIFISIVIEVLFYLGLIYLFFFTKFIFLIVLFLVGFYYSYKIKNFEVHDVLLFGFSFLIFYYNKIDYLFLILILIMTIVFRKSFEKFYFKKEVYSFIVLFVIFIIFDVVKKLL